MKKIFKVIGIILLSIIIIFIINYIRIQIQYRLGNYEQVQDIQGYKNDYVPQGITYSSKYNVILQTSYSNKHDVSMLYITDFNTGKLIKSLKLIEPDNSENTKHVGGITTNDDIVWITSDYEIEEYSLEEIINTNNDYIKSNSRNKLYNRGDYCTYNNGMLLIGDFFLYPIYKVPNNNPLTLAYSIDNLDYNNPVYAISMPIMVQGLAITDNNEYITTQSYTNLINSKLKIYTLRDNNETININGKDIKYYKFNKNTLKKNKSIPPMAEGIFYKDNNIYILFESASGKYPTSDPKIKKIIKYEIK